MNFSAKLKTAQQPNYIFNFNIDIPIKYKSNLTNRSNPVSPGKSPAKPNSKKYKLSSVTPRPTGVSANVASNKKSSTKSGKKSTKVPKTMKEQFLQKDLYQINNFNFFSQQQKPQPSISRKTQKIVSQKKPSYQQQICPSRRTIKNPHSANTYNSNDISQSTVRNNVVRNISILQKLVTIDNSINYRTDFSQMRNNSTVMLGKCNDENFVTKLAIKQQQMKLERENQIKQLLQKCQSGSEQFDLTQIREFEQISTHRKQRLNYEYLKQKILIEASVRKIQRAWKNYRTKKLVNCYSETISKKFLKNQFITSARSETHGLKISKHIKPSNENQLHFFKKQTNQTKRSHNQNKRSNKFKEFQKQSSQSDRSSGDSHHQQDKTQQNRPFSKKPLHMKGKVEGKFFNNQRTIKQSPRLLLLKPSLQRGNQQNQQKIQQYQQTSSIKSERSNQIQQTKRTELKDTRQYEHEIQLKLKKFQEQQIRKWESILDSIKKGKNIDVLLKQSEKYKRELENNLKLQINLAAINQNRASPILFKSQSSQSSLSLNENAPMLKNTIETMKQNITKCQNILIQQSSDINSKENSPEIHKLRHEELNQTAEKRKQKIMFFENEILKIDNQDYSDMSSASCESFTKMYPNNTQEHTEERQRQENIRLRKKLELFNTHFLDLSSADQGLTDRSLKGLKGGRSDDRRANINAKLGGGIMKQKIETQDKKNIKDEPSLSQDRLNRRPDYKLKTNENNPRIQMSKIEELINRKIQYPEEESSSADSSLLGAEQGQDSHFRERNFHELSDNSSNSEVNSPDYTKLSNPQVLYGDPALTHRDKKALVPELQLQKLTKQTQVSQKVQKPQKKQVGKIQIIISKETFNTKKQQLQPDQFKKTQKMPKIQLNETLKICSFLEEQLVYESLLEFSDSNRIVDSIKQLFESYKKDKKKLKPQGICTNLESIKDYLQNFVGFIFQNKLTDQIQASIWTPTGPKPFDLLRYLRKDSQFDSEQNEYIMTIDIFEKHWKYANSNIYFDKKYNDVKTQQQRVNYLKGLTRVYFRSIYDAFNQSLQFQRVYGLTGKAYPWSTKISREEKKTLRSAFQQAYRRILKISVVYYGVHFDDKSKLFNEEDIKELQQERLLTLLTMELQEEEYRWSFIEDQTAEVKYDIAILVEKLILDEFLNDFLTVTGKNFS